MSSASLCRAHIGRVTRASWHSIQKRTDSDLPTYTKKTFAESPETHLGEKLFCKDGCRQLFSSIFSSARSMCATFSSLLDRSCEKPRGETFRFPNLFTHIQPHKECIFGPPPFCRRQFSRWKAYHWHLLPLWWSVSPIFAFWSLVVGDFYAKEPALLSHSRWIRPSMLAKWLPSWMGIAEWIAHSTLSSSPFSHSCFAAMRQRPTMTEIKTRMAKTQRRQ